MAFKEIEKSRPGNIAGSKSGVWVGISESKIASGVRHALTIRLYSDVIETTHLAPGTRVDVAIDDETGDLRLLKSMTDRGYKLTKPKDGNNAFLQLTMTDSVYVLLPYRKQRARSKQAEIHTASKNALIIKLPTLVYT